METIHVTFDEMHQSIAPIGSSSGTSLSTMIAQDAPSLSASSLTSAIHHPVQHQELAEEPTHEDTPINHDVLHPSHNLDTGDPGSAQSSSGNVNSAEPNQVNYPPDHLRRWTKDHPLDNIVGNPSRPVSTRKQLASDALCATAVSSPCKMKFTNYDRLEVWDLCTKSPNSYDMVIGSQVIYKVKLDEYGDRPSEYFIANAATKNMDQLPDGDVKTAFHEWTSWGIQLTQTHSEEWLASLMDLHTASRPDLVFAVFACVLRLSGLSLPKRHFEAIKRVFRYWKGKPLTWAFGIRKTTPIWSSKKQRSTVISTTGLNTSAMLDVVLKSFGCDPSSKTTDLTLIKFLCTVITKVLLLCAVTTSSTLALNTLTYGTISSESKWKIEWLNSTSWKRIINLQIFSPKHYQGNGSNFFFHA
ncbi:hypothetical protein Tco_0652594 [Tanacetum coccineum]|uniref:Uncharacterized protein n=1 Tax=Tanacetum coccineum TaxID=301880 RepID=A0ABQ4WY90_9ASTR